MDLGCSIGKTVKFRCGPAAVTGDVSRIMPLVKPGRREKHETQKPEDLPESQTLLISSWIGKKVNNACALYVVLSRIDMPPISTRKSGIFL